MEFSKEQARIAVETKVHMMGHETFAMGRPNLAVEAEALRAEHQRCKEPLQKCV